VRYRFSKRNLEALCYEEEGAAKYPTAVVDAFFEVIGVVEAARDERDLYALKSLHFERLKGKRKRERSVRLTKQYRLTFALESDSEGKYLEIIEIEKHYQ
jgi:proteic killer suppression protein